MYYLFHSPIQSCKRNELSWYKSRECSIYNSETNTVFTCSLGDAVKNRVTGINFVRSYERYFFGQYNMYLLKFLEFNPNVKRINENKNKCAFYSELNLYSNTIRSNVTCSMTCAREYKSCTYRVEDCTEIFNEFSLVISYSYLYLSDKKHIFFASDSICLSILDILSIIFKVVGSKISNIDTIYFRSDKMVSDDKCYRIKLTNDMKKFVIKYNVIGVV